MARLQILELPAEQHGDDMITPFVLVIDRVEQIESVHAFLADPPGLKEQLGARAILIFDELVEIPANEVPVDPDGYPLKIRVEGDFEQFREQVQEETLYAQGKVTRALRATDQDRKASITDALGMDRLRDWDDIRNAARGLRKDRDAQAAALEHVRNLPEQPELMDAWQPEPNGYRRGYEVAIRDAKRATHAFRVSSTERSPEE